jgi:adenine-specific DNA-methyltransferase
MGRPGTKLARLQESQFRLGEDIAIKGDGDLISVYLRELNTSGDPEDAYRSAIPFEHRRHFGQFFTPLAIAELMSEWITPLNPKRILDPAVGPGIFPRVLASRFPEAEITAIDIDPVALDAARIALREFSNVTYVGEDFLTWMDEGLFDAAIANPPYLRHHDLYYPFDIFYFVGKKNHARISRLSNIYVLFIIEICRKLRPGGRAAVIVPGEWVNANFGGALKRFLLSRGFLRTLLYFSHASTQFEDALTTASVLFLERPPKDEVSQPIRTVFIGQDCPTDLVRRALRDNEAQDGQIVVQILDPNRLLQEKKWNHLLSHGYCQSARGFVPLALLADTRRGIATGCNSFFHISASTVHTSHLRQENLIPCVGRAADVEGLIFTQGDFERLVARDCRSYLLNLHSELDEHEALYIRKGEADGLHERYLCAAHNPVWYSMEKRPPSSIWAAVFGRQGLRFIHNSAGIANLTTFHCIYPKFDTPGFSAALTACLNSNVVQDLGRRQQRVYGGGLLKFEPGDLLDIEVPDLRNLDQATLRLLADCLGELDQAVRKQRGVELTARKLDAAIELAVQEASR